MKWECNQAVGQGIKSEVSASKKTLVWGSFDLPRLSQRESDGVFLHPGVQNRFDRKEQLSLFLPACTHSLLGQELLE